MIIDSPLTFGLTVGVDKRIPAKGDAQVVVPSTVIPFALMTQPHNVIATTLNLANGSGINDVFLTLTAGASVNSNIMVLPAGLYELEFSITAAMNFFATAGLLNGVLFQLIYQGNTINLVNLPAEQKTWIYYGRLRLLLQSSGTLRLTLDTNIAAQTTTAELMVNAIRIL